MGSSDSGSERGIDRGTKGEHTGGPADPEAAFTHVRQVPRSAEPLYTVSDGESGGE